MGSTIYILFLFLDTRYFLYLRRRDFFVQFSKKFKIGFIPMSFLIIDLYIYPFAFFSFSFLILSRTVYSTPTHFIGAIKHPYTTYGFGKIYNSYKIFSSNRPSGPIRSSSRDVRLSVCLMSPSHAIFLRGGSGACVPRPRTGVHVRRPRVHLITRMEP